jgi:hypothetical protein
MYEENVYHKNRLCKILWSPFFCNASIKLLLTTYGTKQYLRAGWVLLSQNPGNEVLIMFIVYIQIN